MKEETTQTHGVIPLRTILRNFLNLVETCEAGVEDGLDAYEKEFQELKQFSETLKSDPAYLSKEGEKPVNRKKNRYKDILPFDYTRVILGDYGDVPGSDYINANFIKGASGSSAYIACQGPLPHTVNDFWRMVVECEVQVIVMACNEQESGKHKCENYWTEDETAERQFGQVTIWLKKCRQVCPDFLVRTMKIRYTNSKGDIEERNVCQFHYSAWPDHGVPIKVRPLLDMVRLIRDCQTSETLPVLVHCSAGCGRTGTICAIDYVWGLLRLGKLTPDFSLFFLVREMRRQRIAMVQTKDQYVLVHRAVRELFEEQLKIIESHPYANVDQNGLPLDIKSDLKIEPTYETVEFRGDDKNLKDATDSSPSLPPSNREVNCKLEKEVENHHQEGRRETKGVPQAYQSAYQEPKPVLELSEQNIEEKLEKTDQASSPETKGNLVTNKSSPTRTSLLRKPSIVKLKAFFEKSKDDKKSGATQLSRAKSDVSSRFYFLNNFTSSNSRGQSSTVKISLATSPTSSAAQETSPVNKPKLKPALLAKPILPIKRSKSLKIGKAESESSDVCVALSSTIKGENRTTENSRGIDGSKSSSNSTANAESSRYSTVTNNPIRVSVEQVEIPKLQKIVSKSVKPEVQIATRHDFRTDIKKTSIDEKYMKAPRKPEVPPKTGVLQDSRRTTNISPPKEKIGDADVQSFQISKYSKLKKYDTVTPKSMSSMGMGTSLTRSQSHIWEPMKVEQPIRIFSDENIHQTGSLTDRGFPMANGASATNSPFRTNDIASRLYEQRIKTTPETSRCHRKNSQELSMSSTPNFFPSANNIKLDYTRDKPVVRRRVPKTNPYANYFPSTSNYSPKQYSGVNSQQMECKPGTEDGSLLKTAYQGDTGCRDIPPLKLRHGRSRENSSESSSNTGTPRSSLPGTPTQTMDSASTQLIKTNLQGLMIDSKKINGIPPKSILKGSLSSTPSESDERLDTHKFSQPMQQAGTVKTNVITAPQKISTVRIAVGVRERRNSFRQAVWKEEENGTLDVEDSPSNHYLFPSANRQTTQSQPTSSSNSFKGRSHKDYEQIWPENGSNASNHFPTGHISFYISPEDRCEPSTHKESINRGLNFHSAPQCSQSQVQNFKRSQSEGRASNASQEGQNRYEEIKILLEELRLPNPKKSAPSDNLLIPHEVEKRNQREKSVSHNSINLRHQRSLRTPRPPQYQQGLSCFTFRKPSCSFESITDQLHTEEYQSFANDLPPSIGGPGGSSKHKETSQKAGCGGEERNVNDYVSLRNCRTSSQPFVNDKTGREDFLNGDTPIPPPRTKRFQQNSKKELGAYKGDIGEQRVPTSSSFSDWGSRNTNEHRNYSISGSNLPEIVRCSNSNYVEQTESTEDTPSVIHPTSPKAIIRALGLFQAKAANMRSRFSSWTEAKDRSNSTKRRNLLTQDNDPKDDTKNDGDGSPSVTSATQLSHPSTSKHQYL